MSYLEAYWEKPMLPEVYSDLVARINDLAIRKSLQVPGSMANLYRAIEQKVDISGLLAAVRGLVCQLRRGEVTTDSGSSSEIEWKVLVCQIEQFGRQETIENYPEYLFSMEGF